MEEGDSYSAFTSKVSKRKELVVGLSLPSMKEPRWVRDKEAMEAYAKDKGIILKVETNDYDADKQAAQVENLISQGIDVLILPPIDTLAAAELVEKAHKAGIKVICYEALARNSDVDLFVAFNNIRVGELQGRYITEKIPKGNYIILSGIPDIGYKEGVMEFVQPLVNIGNIKIVADRIIRLENPGTAFNIVRDALIANNNKIDAIFTPNDSVAGAVIEALKAQGLAGKVAVTGVNADLTALSRIIEGTQLMTVFKDTRELAKAAMEAAVKLSNEGIIKIDKTINNGNIDVPAILISPIAIDKTNIDKVLIDSGYYTKEEVYKR